MSNQDKLNLYIRQLHQRLRLGVSLRGAAILTATALITTILLVLILNAFAFPVRGLTGARSLLLLVLGLAAAFALALPLRRLTRRRATVVAESAYPEFQQRLLTFDDREKKGNDPFLELLAADTLSVARDAQPASLVPNNKLYFLAGAGVACLGVLVWLVAAGPGYMGYGASLLWTGPKAVPLYDIRVTPGDVAVRRNSDQMVTARSSASSRKRCSLFARYKSARAAGSRWRCSRRPRWSNFQFLFAGLPENVEYYVQAGPLASRHFKFRVVDLPSVKQMRVTYHYPKWTGMQQVTEEHGGDLRAIEGTDAELTVPMDRPLRNGQLTLDDGKADDAQRRRGQCLQGLHPHAKGWRLPCGRTRSGAAGASVGGLLHCDRQSESAGDCDRPAGRRLSRQSHRGSHGRGEGVRRIWPEQGEPALFGERRPGKDGRTVCSSRARRMRAARRR